MKKNRKLITSRRSGRDEVGVHMKTELTDVEEHGAAHVNAKAAADD